MTIHDITATRRGFLAGAGLVIGVSIAPKFLSAAPTGVPAGGGPELLPLNAFVKIATDDTITILSKHIEFGQGPFTGLATLLAEELGADWSQMRAVHSPTDNKIYANLLFGLQGTGGSSSIANAYEQMRQARARLPAPCWSRRQPRRGRSRPPRSPWKRVASSMPRRPRKAFRRLCGCRSEADATGQYQAKGPQGFRAHWH
jgi:hypothetical protein